MQNAELKIIMLDGSDIVTSSTALAPNSHISIDWNNTNNSLVLPTTDDNTVNAYTGGLIDTSEIATIPSSTAEPRNDLNARMDNDTNNKLSGK